MARAGRLAGAIVAETEDAAYLVGNTKVPCDFAAAGFEEPHAIDGRAHPYVRIVATRPIELPSPVLVLDTEGEALPRLLARTFLIERTGSVSERLWRLVVGHEDEEDTVPADTVPARWLSEMPDTVWQIVRDTVLRCT